MFSGHPFYLIQIIKIIRHNSEGFFPRCGIGLASFGCAASEQVASGMGASCDTTDENPTHISPLPAFPTKHKAILTFGI